MAKDIRFPVGVDVSGLDKLPAAAAPAVARFARMVRARLKEAIDQGLEGITNLGRVRLIDFPSIKNSFFDSATGKLSAPLKGFEDVILSASANIEPAAIRRRKRRLEKEKAVEKAKASTLGKGSLREKHRDLFDEAEQLAAKLGVAFDPNVAVPGGGRIRLRRDQPSSRTLANMKLYFGFLQDKFKELKARQKKIIDRAKKAEELTDALEESAAVEEATGLPRGQSPLTAKGVRRDIRKRRRTSRVSRLKQSTAEKQARLADMLRDIGEATGAIPILDATDLDAQLREASRFKANANKQRARRRAGRNRRTAVERRTNKAIALDREVGEMRLELGIPEALASGGINLLDSLTRERNALRRERARRGKEATRRKDRFRQNLMTGASAGIGLLGSAGFPLLNVAFSAMSSGGNPIAVAVAAFATAVGETYRALAGLRDRFAEAADSIGFVSMRLMEARTRAKANEAFIGGLIAPSLIKKEELKSQFFKENPKLAAGLGNTVTSVENAALKTVNDILRSSTKQNLNRATLGGAGIIVELGKNFGMFMGEAIDKGPAEARAALDMKLRQQQRFTADSDPYEYWLRVQSELLDPTKDLEEKLLNAEIKELREAVKNLTVATKEANEKKVEENKFNFEPFKNIPIIPMMQ